MNTLVVCILCMLAQAAPALAPANTSLPSPAARAQAPARDGQHDFDVETGTWTTRLARLDRPLTGSKTWLTYQGTSVVRRILDGRANLVELSVAGPAGRIEGLSLRLYHPQSRQWSLHFSNVRDGALTAPVTGQFTNGRGEFHGQETLDRTVILVRFVISRVTDDCWRFEQAFSADGGKTWEDNWIAVDTRTSR
jgi:hypothetical protein